MKNKNMDFFGKIWIFLKYFFITIVIIFVIYKVWDWYKYNYTNNAWTLIISSTETPNVNYNIKKLEGIKTREECYKLAPLHTPVGGSWECDRGDLFDKYGYQVYKEVCTATGCKD